MHKKHFVALVFIVIAVFAISFKNSSENTMYTSNYFNKIAAFKESEEVLYTFISKSDISSVKAIENIKLEINKTRLWLKANDFWLRYLDPVAQKKINGPLPVEWETEVFEKFEKPYRRQGAGLTLATLYLDEPSPNKDSLLSLIDQAIKATSIYAADSTADNIKTYHHFFLCNRLYLLNLAAIYTTGFECPDTAEVIPELRSMMTDVNSIYASFNKSFEETPLTKNYLQLYLKAIAFVKSQNNNYSTFNHFAFIKDYVNPLFAINQQLINQYKVVSKSYVDYTLSKTANSIFTKSLYRGQNAKGVFLRVEEKSTLAEIENIGRQLFYDPILSGNNLRSCASCHNSTAFFTDTLKPTSLQYNRKDFLPRNSPSLLNTEYNHLLMLDGKHISLQSQVRGVISSSVEMGGNAQELLQKVLSCKEYKVAFKKLLKQTPQETEVGYEHIISAITYFYSKFSKGYSPFDEAMNNNMPLSVSAEKGFNLFMGKAQCATCHFVPQFNGTKPPFVSSEFEVLGVPEDTLYKKLSGDKGRYGVNEAKETLNAFRTSTLRNSERTKPYMHNGVFNSLNQVIDFYDAGGGTGHGLTVSNQTLSGDSLHLSVADKQNLIAFIKSLNEDIPKDSAPQSLPVSKNKTLNSRKVGGTY